MAEVTDGLYPDEHRRWVLRPAPEELTDPDGPVGELRLVIQIDEDSGIPWAWAVLAVFAPEDAIGTERAGYSLTLPALRQLCADVGAAINDIETRITDAGGDASVWPPVYPEEEAE